MRKIPRILLIVQRSNGDVLLSSPLIEALFVHYGSAHIDLVVNDDTLGIAQTLPHIRKIFTYSYAWRKNRLRERVKREFMLFRSIYRKYDISINLTTSDRSVLYALFSGKQSISAIERKQQKSWWKKYFLTHSYIFDRSQHILSNTMKPLAILGSKITQKQFRIKTDDEAKEQIKAQLNSLGIQEYIIFHPSAQYNYKVYPTYLREELLKKLNTLQIPIIVTGANSQIDIEIKKSLPKLPYLYDFIAQTSLKEYIALSAGALGYIGMDTLNMHIAAGQDKAIFAIFGPTLPKIWSPWSNEAQCAASTNAPFQKYGKIRLFQADMPCVACGLAGCDDKHGKSDCLEHINPEVIFNEVVTWLER